MTHGVGASIRLDVLRLAATRMNDHLIHFHQHHNITARLFFLVIPTCDSLLILLKSARAQFGSPYPSKEAPSYTSHRMSQTFDPSTPPPPPPKPNSEEVSRQSTPGPLPPRPSSYHPQDPANRPSPPTPGTPHQRDAQQSHVEPDPGPNWLPKILQDKSFVVPLLYFISTINIIKGNKTSKKSSAIQNF